MKPICAVMAVLASCGAPPGVDIGGSTTTAVDASTAGDEPTVATSVASTGEPTAGDACDPAVTACTGEQEWLKAFPVAGAAFFDKPVEVTALAIAVNGDIVATGLYGGTIEFADQSITSIGVVDVWVARFDADGTPQWFRRFGGPDPTPDQGYDGARWGLGNIAFAADGDILVAANCINTIIDFGFGPLVGDDLDPVVFRLSPSGQPRWAHRHVGLYGGDGEFPIFIAPGGDGRVWLAGTLYGPGIDLGGGVLHCSGVPTRGPAVPGSSGSFASRRAARGASL